MCFADVEETPQNRAAAAAAVGKKMWESGHQEEARNFMQGAAEDIEAGRPVDLTPESLKPRAPRDIRRFAPSARTRLRGSPCWRA